MRRFCLLVLGAAFLPLARMQDSRPVDVVIANVSGALERICLIPKFEDCDNVEVTAFSPSGDLVAIGDRRGRVVVYRVADGAAVMSAKITASSERWKGKPIQPYVNGSGHRIRGLLFVDGENRLLAFTGAGDVVRFVVASGAAEKRHELDMTVSVVDIDRTHGRFVVGDGGGTVVEYSLDTFEKVRVYQSADGEFGVCFVRYVESDKALLTAHGNYSRPQSSETAVPKVDDKCLTRWSTTDGARLVSYGGPEGYVEAAEDPISGIVYAGSDRGKGPAAYQRSGESLASPEFVGCPVGILVVGDRRFIVGMTAGDIDICDLEGRRLLRTEGSEVRHRADTLSVAPRADRLALGLPKGGVVVYRFLPRDGRPFVESIRGASASGFGLTLTESGRFFGHADEILEIAVAPSGKTVVSRDGSGRVIIWRKRSDGGFDPRLLALTIKNAYRGMRAFSFAPDESSLCLVTDDRSLRFVSLDDSENSTDLVVKDGDRPISIMTALDLGADRLAIAAVDGGLYLAERSSGKVTTTLVPHDPSTANVPPSSPFTWLIALDEDRSFLAVPHEIKQRLEPLTANDDQWRVRRFGVREPHSEAIGTVEPMGRIGLMRLDGKIILANGWQSNRIVALGEKNLDLIAQGHLGAGDGVAAVTNDVGIGASGGVLSLIRVDGGKLRVAQLSLHLGHTRVIASSPSSRRVYVGTKSGMIIELDVVR